MTDAQEDPELRRLMNAYVQSILARNRSVPTIGEFIVSFSHMQASIEDAVVEIVGRDAKILLAGERGPEASRSEMSFRHFLTGRAQSDAARRVIKLFHGEVNELIQYRNRIAHDAWRFSGDAQEASIDERDRLVMSLPLVPKPEGIAPVALALPAADRHTCVDIRRSHMRHSYEEARPSGLPPVDGPMVLVDGRRVQVAEWGPQDGTPEVADGDQ